MSANDLAAAAAPVGITSRFAGTLMDILDRVEYSRVDLRAEDHAVYRLRYEAYRREDSIPFSPQGLVRDEFDDAPNAQCFGIHIDGELVSSVRFHLLTPECRIAPSLGVFPDILEPMLDRGMTFIDPTRFTADKEASLAYPALPFLTLRIAVMATEHYNADYCLALVRPEHAAFYMRVFGSVAMSEARPYPGLAFPTRLFGSDSHINLQKIYSRYPFFLSTEEERQALFAPPAAGKFDLLLPATSRQAFERVLENDNEQAIAAQ